MYNPVMLAKKWSVIVSVGIVLGLSSAKMFPDHHWMYINVKNLYQYHEGLPNVLPIV